MKRRRLEVEAWRDAMLAVSGTLNRARGGPSLDLGDPRTTGARFNGTVKRRELNDVLRLHDFPTPSRTAQPLANYHAAATALHAEQPLRPSTSLALAKRLRQRQRRRIQRAFDGRTCCLFGRPATAAQLRLGLDFLTACE